MKNLIKKIATKVLSLSCINPVIHRILKRSSPKSSDPNNIDLPDIVSRDSATLAGVLRRILPFSDKTTFTPDERYAFQLSGLNSSALTRLIYWYGIPPMDFYIGSPIWKIVSQARTILDIGANIGLYTFLFKQAAPQSTIVAFEPAPKVFETLQNNLKLNQCEAQAFPYAITDFCGEISLHIPPTECDASTRDSLPEEADSLNIPYTTQKVPAFTLDAIFSDLKLERVDFIKLDTEGTEPSVLRGMTEILKQFTPDIFCEVVYGTHTEQQLESLLKPFNYNFYHLINGQLTKVDSICPDANKKHLNFFFSTKDLLV